MENKYTNCIINKSSFLAIFFYLYKNLNTWQNYTDDSYDWISANFGKSRSFPECVRQRIKMPLSRDPSLGWRCSFRGDISSIARRIERFSRRRWRALSNLYRTKDKNAREGEHRNDDVVKAVAKPAVFHSRNARVHRESKVKHRTPAGIRNDARTSRYFESNTSRVRTLHGCPVSRVPIRYMRCATWREDPSRFRLIIGREIRVA